MSPLIHAIIIDLILILLITLPSIYFKLFGDPIRRGFFCDDESIRLPYRPESYNSDVMWPLVYVIPSFLMYIVEMLHIRRQNGHWISRRNFCCFVKKVWPLLVSYTFGSMAINTLLNIVKYGIGRLRPHFIDACRPIDPITGIDLSNCTLLPDPHRYIEDYMCSKSEHWNLRLSFFSGHATHMSYMAIYTSIYLQNRVPPCAGLLRHVLQSALIYLAAFITYSRFVDNYHHPDDLVAGVLIGTTAALITARFIAEPSLLGARADGESCIAVYKPSTYKQTRSSKSEYEPMPSTSGFCYPSDSRKSSKSSNKSSSQSIKSSELPSEKAERQSLLYSSTEKQSQIP